MTLLPTLLSHLQPTKQLLISEYVHHHPILSNPTTYLLPQPLPVLFMNMRLIAKTSRMSWAWPFTHPSPNLPLFIVRTRGLVPDLSEFPDGKVSAHPICRPRTSNFVSLLCPWLHVFPSPSLSNKYLAYIFLFSPRFHLFLFLHSTLDTSALLVCL